MNKDTVFMIFFFSYFGLQHDHQSENIVENDLQVWGLIAKRREILDYTILSTFKQ